MQRECPGSRRPLPELHPFKTLRCKPRALPGRRPGTHQEERLGWNCHFSRAIPAQPYPAPAGPPVSAGGEAVSGLQNPAQQVAALLRQPLAEQQAGFGALFAQVSSLMTTQAAGKASLPDPVVKAMQQILGLRLNSAQSLTGKDLQQAVRLSGQFREAQAMRPGSGLQPLPDLKSALLSLKALLQQLGAEAQVSRPAGQPPVPSRHGAPQGQAQQGGSGHVAGSTPQNLQSLLQETDSALARMRLTQFVNSGLLSDEGPRAASRPMDIVLELPLALGHETAVMQMQVGRDGGGRDGEEEQEPAWRLRFCPGPDGNRALGGCDQPARRGHLRQSLDRPERNL
ncbi:hypothetical protein QW131_04520 [Roseibium salinum]|nr:hypothetical protein [Roseibium salinum]